MKDWTDRQLLIAYAKTRSEAAFAEVVRRHVDLVHTAALRMLRNPDSARDVTQDVFLALAKNARNLATHSLLSGWLHCTARNLAANSVRSNVRRQIREEQAAVMHELSLEDPDSAWEQVAPHIDAALGELNRVDRETILLRYFESKSTPELAQILGVSDEAAQKRVSRAVDHLRAFLIKRGFAIGATVLVSSMTKNAVLAAPVALKAAITAACSLAGVSLTTGVATKTIVMTSLQKTVVVSILGALVIVTAYESVQSSGARSEIKTLKQQNMQLAGQIDQLAKERADATNRLATLREESERLVRDTRDLLKLRGEVARLRKQGKSTSLSEPNAASILTQTQFPTTQEEFDELRRVTQIALGRIGAVLREFMTNNPYGVIVDDSGKLSQSIFTDHVAMPSDKFKIKIHDAQQLALLMEQQPKFIIAQSAAPILFESRWTHFYLHADGTTSSTTLGMEEEPTRNGFLLPDSEVRALAEAHDPERRLLAPALEAFRVANNGRKPTDPSELEPYITIPEQSALLQKQIKRPARLPDLRNATYSPITNFALPVSLSSP